MIKPFLEECIKLMKARKCFYNFIYAGDGVIAVCDVNNNPQIFTDVYHCAVDINSYLKHFSEWVKIKYQYGFDAGIGIAWDEQTYIEKIKDLDTDFNNTLYVGNSISVAAKLSGKRENQFKKFGIAVTRGFYKKLNADDAKDFKNNTKKRKYTDIEWEE